MIESNRVITHEGDTMDDVQFDSLTRQVTARLSRRTGLRFLTSLGVLALLPAAAAAKRKKHKKKKTKPSPPPLPPSSPPSPPPPPGCTPQCAGKQCGADGCGGSCGTCGLGTVCLSDTCQNC